MASAKKSAKVDPKKLQSDKEDLLEQLDEVTRPDNMSKREALDFMEELIDDIGVRCEALREELDDSERETSDE
jgi:hypothetical protein